MIRAATVLSSLIRACTCATHSLVQARSAELHWALGTDRNGLLRSSFCRRLAPVEQDDGPAPVCAIAYAPEYARLMGFFRAILESNERSPRVLELTAL